MSASEELETSVNNLAEAVNGDVEKWLEESQDDILDVEYTLGSDFELVGVSIWTCIGGPTVWIDTRTEEVVGRWGSERAAAVLDHDAATAIEGYYRGMMPF